MTDAKTPLPTPDQANWQDMELTMFVHFDPAVYVNSQGGDANVPLNLVDPEKLDTDQWVENAKAFGAKMLIFTAKHAGGFAWWQTDTTDYGVRQLAWRGGKGDVMAMLSESCRKAGMAMGVYLSPQDAHKNVGCGAKTGTREEHEAYARTYRQQLTEVLTRYGEMLEVWFDGSLAFDLADILKARAPHAMIFQSAHATIRWVGNESGITPYPSWNTVRRSDALSGISTAVHSVPDGDTWLPIESDTTIRGHKWFWNEGHDHLIKPLDHLMEIYYRSVGHGSVLLLNSNPDRRGLVPDADLKRTREFGDAIRNRFAKAVAETRGEGTEMTLDFRAPTRIDHVVAMEDIRRGGERMRAYTIEGFRAGKWFHLVSGSAVGHKKIDFFPAVEVERVRMRTVQANGVPLIRRLAAYFAGSIPSNIQNRSAGRSIDVAAWGPDTFRTDNPEPGHWIDHEVTREYDISFACDSAGQYRLEFAKESGKDEIAVEPLCIVCDGREYPEWIQGRRDDRGFGFSLPGVIGSLRVRTKLKLMDSTDFYGQVRIWRE